MVAKAYKEATKLAPPRFMTLRLHPTRLKEVEDLSSVISLQLGIVIGNLGKRTTKLACVSAPNGISQGITVKPDPEVGMSKLLFEIHGNAAYTFEIPE